MNVSAIIPTYNRNRDLGDCLNSLFAQTESVAEIIIVDNSKDSVAEPLAKEFMKKFAEINCQLVYVGNNINSLTVARNLGARKASGDIVLFLDDDVILDKDYVRELLEVFKNNTNALGVQGYINPGLTDLTRNRLFRLFYWYHLEDNKSRVLPSVSATYPLKLDRVIECQWLSGANHSYRRIVLEEFQYDENLMKYSDGEDLDFSYRVYKKYPGSLFMTPAAKLVHNTSMSGRALGKELVYMQEIYGLYLFCKLFDATPKNVLIYFWSRIGRFFITLLKMIAKRYPGSWHELKHLVGAYVACLNNKADIKEGRLGFFNITLS